MREINKHRKMEEREYLDRREADRRDAVAEYILKLEEANSNISLKTVLEVVYPVKKLGRAVSLHKGRMMPAETSHVTQKESIFSGWMEYRKVVGHYILIEEVTGYVIESPEDDFTQFRDDVIIEDGRVGTLLKPTGRGYRNYEYGNASVHLEDSRNRFEKRNCQAVWGPSLVVPEQLSTYQAWEATRQLGELIIRAQVE